jgi:hypothetical protein
LKELQDDPDEYVRGRTREVLEEAFGVDASCSNYSKVMRMMKERTRVLGRFNEQLELVVDVIIEMEKESGEVSKNVLYKILVREHGIDEDEVVSMLLQLYSEGIVYSPKPGFTKICG